MFKSKALNIKKEKTEEPELFSVGDFWYGIR